MNHLESIKEELSEKIGGIDFDALDSLKSESQTKREEWLKKRKGRFTASEASRLMGYEDKLEFPAGAKTYAIEKALDLITDDERTKRKQSDEMQWGSNTEVEAVEFFIETKGIEVINYGEDQVFYEKGKDISATPDGVILNKEGSIEGTFESKCPNAKTHLYYMENINLGNFKKELTDYYWQILVAMYCTGASYCYFVSYDPTFKNPEKRLFVLKIMRNEADLNKFRRRVAQAIKERNYYVIKYQ